MSFAPIIRAFEAAVDDVRPQEKAVISKIGGMGVDRHNTQIRPDGLDLTAFRANPVILHEHGRSPARGTIPVGRCQWIKVDGERLVAKSIFRNDDYSQALWEAYRDGDLRGWSLSMLPIDASPPTREEIRSMPELANCETVFRKGELLEYSCVSIPSNREALTTIVSRGIWVPDSIKSEMESRTAVSVAIPRTMTDSEGGLEGGGATVEPDEPGDERSAGEAPEVTERDGRFFAKCDRCEGGPYETREEAMAHRCGVARDAADGDPTPDEMADGGDAERSAPDEGEHHKLKPTHGIKKEGDEYVLVSNEGKLLGRFPSREAAEKRLREIEYFKHEGRSADDAPADAERSAPEPEPEPEAPDPIREELERLRSHAGPTVADVVRLELLRLRAWSAEKEADLIAHRDLYERGIV